MILFFNVFWWLKRVYPRKFHWVAAKHTAHLQKASDLPPPSLQNLSDVCVNYLMSPVEALWSSSDSSLQMHSNMYLKYSMTPAKPSNICLKYLMTPEKASWLSSVLLLQKPSNICLKHLMTPVKVLWHMSKIFYDLRKSSLAL